jgi:hypothetical protein
VDWKISHALASVASFHAAQVAVRQSVLLALRGIPIIPPPQNERFSLRRSLSELADSAFETSQPPGQGSPR